MKYGIEPDRDNELLGSLSKDLFNKTYYQLTKKQRKEVDFIYMETAEQYDFEFYEMNYERNFERN